MSDNEEYRPADNVTGPNEKDDKEQQQVIENGEHEGPNTAGLNQPLEQNGGADEEAEAEALLKWVQAVDSTSEEGVLSKHVETVEDLCDGVAFFDVLSTIDPTYFRNPHNADTKDNWVLKIGTLKRLYKLIMQYYIETLSQSPSALGVPDLNSLARDSSSADLVRLGRLALGVAIRSEKAGDHIGAIQSLDLEDQQQLMVAIENVMSSLKSIEDQNGEGESGDNVKGLQGEDGTEHSQEPLAISQLRREKENLEKLYLELMESHRTLQATQGDTQAEKEEAVKELSRFKEETEEKRKGQVDVLMRQDIERLKEELRRSEDNLAEAESEVERLTSLGEDMSKKVDDLQKKADEGVKLKDQLDEYKHAAEKLQRTENVIEKYKKKLEEGVDVRRQLKVLEDQNAELVDKNAQIEDEYKRVAAFKPLMDSYKSQINELEAKASNLQRDLNSSRFEQEQTALKLKATEEARAKEKEEMELYQERINELELGGTGKRRKGTTAGASDVNGVEGLAAANEGEEEDLIDEVDLEDALEGTSLTSLKIKIRKLTRELEAARANKADASRLLVVENLLEDANKMKARYETDYLEEHKAKLILQKQMDEIQSGKSALGDGAEANYALRLRLNELVEELDKVKREHGELTVEYDQTIRDLNIARSDLNLVDKDKLDALTEIRANVDAEKADLDQMVARLKKQLEEAEEKNRMQLSQLNSVLMDKVDLQSHSLLKSEEALKHARDMGEMRTSLADETLPADADELITSLREQVKGVQDKLAKARVFIKQQDKMIKDKERAATDVGVGAPEEVVARAKRAEEENRLLKQEQRLMASAFFGQGARLLRETMVNNNSRTQSRGSAAAVMMNANPPRSWLAQQRRNVVAGIPLSRR